MSSSKTDTNANPSGSCSSEATPPSTAGSRPLRGGAA